MYYRVLVRKFLKIPSYLRPCERKIIHPLYPSSYRATERSFLRLSYQIAYVPFVQFSDES